MGLYIFIIQKILKMKNGLPKIWKNNYIRDLLGTPNVENLKFRITKGKRLFRLIITIQKIIEAYVLIQWTLGADL